MGEVDVSDPGAVLGNIQGQALRDDVRITLHAQQEMAEEGIAIEELLETIARGHILENYAQHRRGACCLLSGATESGRPLHVVCTTARPTLIVITVYEPKPPKWVTPVQRRTEK